jgi:CRP-like cAMP-binding protein
MQPAAPVEHVLAKKLGACFPDQSPLTEEEVAVLLKLGSANRSIRRASDIILQGRKCDSVFVLASGSAVRYKTMANGRRQILSILLPGDMIGYPACFFDTALYSVTALTQVVVCVITFADLATVFRDHPRLALAFYWSAAHETAAVGEHLTDVGRRNAYERLAHFLLETGVRLAAIGCSDGRTFEMPVPQTKIADVLGLSIPHINRMLRRLREERLLEMRGQHVHILDREALAAVAEFDDSYLAGRVTPAIVCFDRGRVDKHDRRQRASPSASPGGEAGRLRGANGRVPEPLCREARSHR